MWRRCPVNAEHKNEGTFDQHPPAGLVHNTGRRLAEAHHAPEAGHWCPAVTDAGSSITLYPYGNPNPYPSPISP